MSLSAKDQQILKVIKRKLSNQQSALSMGMDMEDYIERRNYLKSLILQNEITIKDNYIAELEDVITESNINLDAGTGTLKGIFSTEPMDAAQVELMFKIDKNTWRLSSYWNKQKSDGRYLISANITQLKKGTDNVDVTEELSKIIHSFNYSYTPTAIPNFNSSFNDPICAVLSLQDIHVGKMTIDNVDSTVEDVKKCVQELVMKAYHSNYIDKIVWVLGGDLLNMDTYTGTTTQGTLVENSMTTYQAYKTAFDLQFWCINYLKEFCNTLEVVYIPGNHDRESSAHIAYALSRLIVSDDIIWSIDYAERKAIQYGINMIGLEHGDYSTAKSFFVFATEFAEMWGKTKYRVVYTGHYHKKKTIEYVTLDEVNGFQLKVLPSLSKTDMYHYSNKWTGNQRGGIIELHSFTKGPIGYFNYNA